MFKKRFVVLAIFLIALTAVSAVSAADNQTDIATQDTGILTDEILADSDVGTFKDLNDNVTGTHNELKLLKNYTYNPNTDGGLENGIVISEDNYVIDGQGHTINGSSQAMFFMINANNVTLKNINFVNGMDTYGSGKGVVSFSENGTVTGCNFTKNDAPFGALYFIKAGSADDCIFKSNYAAYTGSAVYFGGDGTLTNSIITANSAGQGTPVQFQLKAIVDNCNFTDNIAGAIDFNGDEGFVINSNFINNKNSRGGAAIHSNKKLVIESTSFINNAANSASGGAINLAADGSIINNCNFTNNTAMLMGGAIFSSGKVQINNSNFKDNTAGQEGGVLYLSDNSTIENSNFTNNHNKNDMCDGGAIYFEDEGNVINCNFNDNFATQWGGAIYFNSIGSVKGSKFNNNKAYATYGGGIYFKGEGTVSLSNFTDNFAIYGGGVYFGSNGSVENSNFDHNTGSTQGGGVYFNNTGSVENSVFTNNYAGVGGAAVYFNMKGTVKGSNFTNNEANSGYGSGGAIFINGNNASIEGSNFINNNASNGGAIYAIGSLGRYCILTVNNSNFMNNKAFSSGGAIMSYLEAIVENSDFINSTAGQTAGAIFCDSKCTVKGSSFMNNNVTGPGGAIRFNAESSVENSVFKNNFATAMGGAIYFNGKGSVKSSNFTKNSANLIGGAIQFMGEGTVESSNFEQNNALSPGGAIYFSSKGTVKGSNFTKNTADVDGGAVYFGAEGTVSLSNFESNKATRSNGGAICFNNKGNVTGSNFTKNTAKENYGGAIHFNGEGTVTASNFESNEAMSQGGAINFNGRGTVESSNFTNNKVSNSNGYGGAINYMAIGKTKDSNFSNNEAFNGGAVALRSTDSAGAANNNVNHCYFNNNVADGSGGAVYIITDGKVENSIFADNSAKKGGAIYTLKGKVSTSNFTNNTAAENGGAIYLEGYFEIDESNFTFNQANNMGGAVYVSGNGEEVVVHVSNSYFQNNKAKSYRLELSNPTDENCPVINITFEGNEIWMNAIFAFDVVLSNNVYWNGSMVNSDDVVPSKNSYPGINITVEVYDSNSNLVDNVTLVTNNASQVFYDSVKLDAGNYKLKAYHIDDNYYTAIKSTEVPFTVIKNSTSVTINIDNYANFNYGNCNIGFEVINRTEVRVVITNRSGEVLVNQTTEDNFIVVDLLPGDYNITVYNKGTEIYSSSSDSKLFTIVKANSTIVIQKIVDPIYGNEFDVSITGDNLTSINVTVYDKDNNVVFTEILEEYIAHMPVLPAGPYTLVAVNLGNELINESRNSTTFNVLKAPNSVNITVNDVVEGVAVVINVTADVDGNYTLDVNGEIQNVTVTNGKFNLTINLPVGSYYVNATFDNPNYDSNITNATFRILNTMIEAADAKYALNDKYAYQAKLVDEDGNPVANRTLTFAIDGNAFNATTNDQGIANITFNVAIGTYDMAISNNYTDNVTVKVTVLPRIVENSDMVMDYDSDKFKVKALGDDGNPIANEIVKMTVNGVTYNVKTDKNGYATLPIELKPKTYTITSSYKGTTVKNTIKVKYTLKAKKTVKVKKTAKKLILKATLKWSNGKAIAGKKITIRFKGKTYTVKTNKKGIAKKVLTKNVIKKLRKGKTYKAKITYKNETATTKVKVRR